MAIVPRERPRPAPEAEPLLRADSSLVLVPVHVTNAGNRTSDYVALAFVSGEFGPKPYPIKTLASYARVRDVKAGAAAAATAELQWTVGNLARYDESGNTVLFPGTYTLTLDEPTQATVQFVLEGEAVVLDKWPAPPS